MTPDERRELLKSLDELEGSLAWAHLSRSLDASVLEASYRISAESDVAGVHFIRGAIWAFQVLKSLPANLKQQAINEISLEELMNERK